MAQNYVVTGLGGFAPRGRNNGARVYAPGEVLTRDELLELCGSGGQAEKLVRAKILTPEDRVVANPRLFGRLGTYKAPDGDYGRHRLVTSLEGDRGTPAWPSPQPVAPSPEAALLAMAAAEAESEPAPTPEADAEPDEKPVTYVVTPHAEPELPPRRRRQRKG